MKINCIYSIILSVFIRCFSAFNCHLPFGCRIEKIYPRSLLNFNEKGTTKVSSIFCDVRDNNFTFKFPEPTPQINNGSCNINSESEDEYFEDQKIIFRWQSNEIGILDRHFNFTNVIRYFSHFNPLIHLSILSFNGFGLNFMEKNINLYVSTIRFNNVRLEFYHNKKKITSCKELIDFNPRNIKSIFQIIFNEDQTFKLTNVDYKNNICPLLFQNANIYYLLLEKLTDSFYKKNVLTFTNDRFETLNSNIKHIQLNNVEYINLDLNLLNPSVFNNTMIISVTSGFLNSISEEIFIGLKSLNKITLMMSIFRKINHKQGIKWIKNINYNVNVNLSDLYSSINWKEKILEMTNNLNDQKRVSKYFPEEDFCIYVDFPFKQFVIPLMRSIKISRRRLFMTYINKDPTCTYLWLIHHYEYYYRYYVVTKPNTAMSLRAVINTTDFQSISKCEFERKISLCNRSNYQVKDIWDEDKFFILNKKLEIIFKISLHPIAFLCLFTNFIVVIVILKKENSDLFKECQQYSYLCLNSIICILISVIEILSWMTECFYPFEVFCPEIRKLAAIQFFKIIFKECFVTMFRFMCNFTYIAFALNRISLIGTFHGKLVTFMSEVGFKKYIGVTLIISIIFSWIKFFKYEVNYFYPDAHYPLSNELDILSAKSSTFNDFYFIFNSISDIVNYIIFVIICAVIDICMVVQLRIVLDEKTRKSESLNQNQNQNQSKKAENEEAVNKAIKMVVLNSVIGILFKLPISFIPFINMIAEFYYKDPIYIYQYPLFHEFYLSLYESGFYTLIQDLSSLFYTFSLSIQMFIYKHFDKKFQTGFDRLKEITINGSKNCLDHSS